MLQIESSIIRFNPIAKVDYEKKPAPKMTHISKADFIKMLSTPIADKILSLYNTTDDSKSVFISSDVRDRLDRIVRVLGGRRMSVSGIIENIVRHHLNLYEEEFEAWRKL